MHSSHTVELTLPDVSPSARLAHIFEDMPDKSLLSIGPLCNDGCEVLFRSGDVSIRKNDREILHGTRDVHTGLWFVDRSPILQAPDSSVTPSPAPFYAFSAFPAANDAARLAFFHAALGSPALSTLTQAINRGHLRAFPTLTAALLAKHPPASEAMVKGHLDQHRAHTRSTKPRPLSHQHSTDFHPQQASPATGHVYVAVEELHSDLTGQFPVPAKSGNRYVLVSYHEDSNAILAVPLKSRSSADIVAAYQQTYRVLHQCGFRVRLQRLDNEISDALRGFFDLADVRLQLVPPHVHRQNKAERCIRTFKNHFIAMLCSVDPTFPLQHWDELVPQAVITLNLLRSSRLNPNISAYEHLFGAFDFNKTPLAPPGTRVLVHNKPSVRTTWAPHATNGWSVGPAMEHYRCHRIIMADTQAVRIADTLHWIPHHVPAPATSSDDLMAAAIRDLAQALRHPNEHSLAPSQVAAIKQLVSVFSDAPPEFPPVPAGFELLHDTSVVPSGPPSATPSAHAHASPSSAPPAPDTAPAPLPRVPPTPPLPRVSPLPDVSLADAAPSRGCWRRAPAARKVTFAASVKQQTREYQTYDQVHRHFSKRRRARSAQFQRLLRSAQAADKAAARALAELQAESSHDAPLDPSWVRRLVPDYHAPAAPAPVPRHQHNLRSRQPRPNSGLAAVVFPAPVATPTPTPPVSPAAPGPDAAPIHIDFDDLLAALSTPAHSANLVIDPDTGKSLTYAQLVKRDPTTWKPSLSNEIGRLTQGTPSGTITGSNVCTFISKDEIPAGKIPTYCVLVASIREGKADKYRTRCVAGGDKVPYNGVVATPTADLGTAKILFNHVISTPGAKFAAFDIKDFYLGSTMPEPEYMWIPADLIPEDIMAHYNLEEKIHNGRVYVRIDGGMYGLPQAGRLAHDQLVEHLAKYGYHKVPHTPSLFKHSDRPICFCLVVDDFGVHYVGREHAEHLLSALQDKYTVTTDWSGRKYLGLTLDWNYEDRHVDLSMPNYIANALHKFQHPTPQKPEHAPHAHQAIVYGKGPQLTAAPDTSAPLNPAETKRLQELLGTLLYYGQAIDSSILVALGTLASQQSKGTKATARAMTQLLNYCATYPDATLRYTPSDMILHVHSDASYLSETDARSRLGGYFFLSSAQHEPAPPLNGAIHVNSAILKNVVSSAFEAELGGLFHNCVDATVFRTTLEELGHPQPATPVQTDNSCAAGIVNNTLKQRRSKAIDMRYYWVRDRVNQGQFLIHWKRGAENLADYFTKHHSPIHHQRMRDTYFLPLHQRALASQTA